MRLAAAIVLCLLATPAWAGDLTVTGAVQHGGVISYDALKQLPAVTVTVSQQTDKGPSAGAFTGVLLWTVIQNAAPVDAKGKNAFLRHSFMVTGGDDYQAAISQGEIDPRLEGKQIILAWSKDGQPLAAAELVVPGDAHASRRVHGVTTIDVR